VPACFAAEAFRPMLPARASKSSKLSRVSRRSSMPSSMRQ